MFRDIKIHQGKAMERCPTPLFFFFWEGIPRLPPMKLSHDCNTSETRESEVLILSNLNSSSSVIQLAQAFHIQRNLLLGLSIL